MTVNRVAILRTYLCAEQDDLYGDLDPALLVEPNSAHLLQEREHAWNRVSTEEERERLSEYATRWRFTMEELIRWCEEHPEQVETVLTTASS